jgi:DHA1 family tetracycline resistance protein-like MFS transporter
VVSHFPAGDWRIGAPFFACAVMQGAALVLAWMHFRRMPAAAVAQTTAAH